MASLKNKTVSNIFWSFAEKFTSRGIGFFTTILLARLLTPKDFGLIAMLTIFISVSESLSNGGFNHALIQKKDTDEEDYIAVFYINLIASTCLYFILFFSAPYIARFYEQPSLTVLTRVLSLTFIINSFCYIQQTKLTKELKFKVLMKVHIPAVIASAIVAIWMAYSGFGVWSLVAQTLALRFVLAVQLWFQSKWRPLLKVNFNRAKPLFSFGSKIMASTIVDRIYNNIYLIVIGKFYSANILGYYQNSYKLINTPTDTFSSIIRNVTYPAFSSVQSNNDKLKLGLKKSNQQFAFLLLPALTFCTVLAIPLFRLILTEKWLPSVPYFQLLVIVGVFYPLSQFTLDILKVKGQGKLYLHLNLISKGITIVGMAYILIKGYSIWWLIIWQVISSFLQYLLNGYYCGKIIGYDLKRQLSDILPNILLALGISIIIYYIDTEMVNDKKDIYRLLIGFSTASICYVGASFLIKLSALQDFLEMALLLKRK